MFAEYELVCKAENQVALGNFGLPGFRDAGQAVVCAGELAVDGASGVGIVSEVYRQEEAFPEGIRFIEGPEGRLQGVHDISGSADLWRFLLFEGACGDGFDGGMEGVVVRRKNSLRVVLTMDLIQRSVAVEVDKSELETLDSENSGNARDNST